MAAVGEDSDSEGMDGRPETEPHQSSVQACVDPRNRELSTGNFLRGAGKPGLRAAVASISPPKLEDMAVDDLVAKLCEDEALVVVQRLHSSPGSPASPLAAASKRPAPVPRLDLHKLCPNGAAYSRNLGAAECEAGGAADAALCFEDTSNRPINPAALADDHRYYVYRAITPLDNAGIKALLERLPSAEAEQVLRIWDALLVARKDCELLVARGVRVARDVSRDWQDTVSDLIDRVVAQDNEIKQLRAQLKQAPQTCPASEDLHTQIVRLKRHRDKLQRENQELGAALQDTHELYHGAKEEMRRLQDQANQLRAKGRMLQDQHASLLRHHIELATYAEALETGLVRAPTMQAAASAAAGAGCAPAHSGAPIGVVQQLCRRLNSPRSLVGSPRINKLASTAGAALSQLPGSPRMKRLALLARDCNVATGDSGYSSINNSGRSSPGSAHALAQVLGTGFGASRPQRQHAAPTATPRADALPCGEAAVDGARHSRDSDGVRGPDDRIEDQFNAPVGGAVDQPTMPPGKLRWRAGDVPGHGVELHGQIEACKQQLDALATCTFW